MAGKAAVKVEDTEKEQTLVEEDQAFADAFVPDEEVDEYLEGEEALPEEEELPKEEEELPDEANRSSLAGRIASARKGLPKMEASYNDLYGTIPGDPTVEELASQRTVEEAHAHVAEELPEVSQAIAHEVAKVTETVRAEMEVEVDTRASEAHFSAIQHAHPDIADFQNPGSPERDLLTEWIDVHPHPEAKELERVLTSGSTAEVIELLDGFKEEVEQILQESPERVQQNAAEAVPAGRESTLISNPGVEEDDFSGAFEAALADE